MKHVVLITVGVVGLASCHEIHPPLDGAPVLKRACSRGTSLDRRRADSSPTPAIFCV
jgi:hypothetical protein